MGHLPPGTTPLSAEGGTHPPPVLQAPSSRLQGGTHSLFSPQVPPRQRHLHPPGGHLRRRDLPVPPVSTSRPSLGAPLDLNGIWLPRKTLSPQAIRIGCFYPGTDLACEHHTLPITDPHTSRVSSVATMEFENSSSRASVQAVRTICWSPSTSPA